MTRVPLVRRDEFDTTIAAKVDKTVYDARQYAEAARSGPAGVGARNGMYDAGRQLYLPAGVRFDRFQSVLAAVDAGVSGARAHIAWIGHSEVSGQGGTPGVNDAVVSLRKYLAPRHRVGTGCVTAYNNNGGTGSPVDSRWVFDAGFVYSGQAYGSRNIQLHRRAQTAGATATFTSDIAGTIVDIYTFGNTSSFTYSIDGGAPVTVTGNGQNAVQIVTVTGLPDAIHTVVIKSVTATATYILGVGVRSDYSLDVSNLGFWGAESRDWTSNPTLWYAAPHVLEDLAPDLTIIQLDVNEAIHGGRTATDLRADLDSLLPWYKTWGDVALISSFMPSVAPATWDAFRTVSYDMADKHGVALVDLSARFGPRDTANANGLMSDAHHPNAAGYMNTAAAVAQLFV